MTTKPQRLLFVRMDRIGDLVLTLPVDEALPRAQVSWWIPPGLAFVASLAQPPRQFREVAKKITFGEFFKLLGEVRRERFDGIVVFHAPWWVSALAWLARIPLRAGVKSQWHSFIFLNRAIRQKRSRAEHSELEYNFRLAELALGLPERKLARSSLRLAGFSGAERDALLSRFGLQQGRYSVVHPGMGGSALNWPTSHYETLIRALLGRETVAITGTPADEEYLAPLRTLLREEDSVVWLDGRIKGPELITILENARTITAPSTGVLHLAASTGRPTLGIFSPVRVQQPRRWGPQGAQTVVLVPDVTCPGELSCLGEACVFYNCMTTIAPSDALEKL